MARYYRCRIPPKASQLLRAGKALPVRRWEVSFYLLGRRCWVGSRKQDRTLANQLSGAFVTFGALVAGAFVLTALAYAVGWAWLTPESEGSRQAEKAESAAYAAMLDEELASAAT
jgi:hypothetical protein